MIEQTTGRIAYPGLRPFTRDEFDLFFGRENCVDEMVDTLAATRFLAVLGTSGSGKSSLVRTGLLNALELGFLAAAGSNWQIADLRPRGHPIRSLAVALLGLQGNADPDEGEIEILSAFLRRGPRSLIEWYEAGHLPEGDNLVVLADQFEELFRYEDYSGREEAEAFVALLIEAARETRPPLYVVITMRSEYLGACTLIEGLPEMVNRGLYLTPRMSREECRQAIVGPAEVTGFAIEEALVNKLLNDLTDFAPWEAEKGHDQGRRLGRRADQLPLMQHVLNLLWQRARERNDENIVLTLADYEAARGLAGALDRHADEIASRIDAAHADVIDTVFKSLVTGKSVTEAVRRPTVFGDLVTLAAGRRESVAAVVDGFRAPGINFLTPSPPEPLLDNTFVDISHESLIRQWQRLSLCLNEEAQSADAWNQLLLRSERYKAGTGGLLTGLDLDNLMAWWKRAEPTEAWAGRYGNNYAEAQAFLEESQAAEAERQRQEDEDQRKLIEAEEAARSGTRFKRLSGALAAAVVLAILGAGAAVYLWREANQQATLATEQALIADQQREEAETQRQLADRERERAEEQATIADRERERAEEQAAIADQQREEAEKQRQLAERERERAVAAAAAAEQAREEAVAAREEAARANARLIAQQLASRVSALHVGMEQNPDEVSRAGNLLARAAEAAYVADPADATVENATTVELLRPTLAFQAMLAKTTIPETTIPGEDDVTRWRDPPGGPGLGVLVNWSFLDEAEFFRVIDPIGRIVARFPMPNVPTAYEKTPVGAAVIGPDIPTGLLITADGNIWAASGENGSFARYTDGMEGEADRIDDVRYDPVGERLYIAYAGRPPGSAETVPRVMILGRQGKDWSDWAKLADYALGPSTLGVLPPVRIAGVADDVAFVVAGGDLIGLDEEGGKRTFDGLGEVSDAILTVDGRHLVVGTSVDNCGRLALGPPRDRLTPIPAAITIEPAGSKETIGEPTSEPAEFGCLVLVEAGDGAIEWSGPAEPRMRLGAAYSTGGVDPTVEIVTEAVPDDYNRDALLVEAPWVPTMMWVRRLARQDGRWVETKARFDPAEWAPEGLGQALAAVAATQTAFPAELTKEYFTKLFEARVVPRIAGTLENSDSIIASHIAGNEFKAARIAAGSDGDQELEVRVYRPELGAFVLEESLTPEPVSCPPGPGKSEGACTFVAAGFSPDGKTLALATNYGEHTVVTADEPVAWRGNVVGGESGRQHSSLTGFNALDPEGRAFVTYAANGDLLLLRRPVAAPETPGNDRSGQRSRTAGRAVTPAPSLERIAVGDALWELLGAADGYATDPSIGLIYLWGSNGLLVLSLGGEDGLQAERRGWIESNAIADVGSLGDGSFALATTDGHITLYEVEDGEVVERDSAETGLSSFGAIRLSVANGEIVANAGDAGNYWLRSVAYRVKDGRLEQVFALPWDNFAGQLENGEVVSTAFGAEVFAEPPALPADEDLLALTIMRERRQDDEAANEFRHVFQMLSTRPDGTMASGAEPTCNTAMAVAARVGTGGDGQEAALDLLRRACRLSPGGEALADAIGLEGRDRVLALLRLAKSNPYALAMLAGTLGEFAPPAAEALAAREPWLAHFPDEALVATLAGGAPIPPALVEAYGVRGVGGDPYDHWLLAVIAERRGIDRDSLRDALFHYASAERQLRAAGRPVPAQVVARRTALSRILADDIVIEVFHAVNDEAPASGDRPRAEGPAALQDVADWLVGLMDGNGDTAALNALVAIVEEALGDETVATNPGSAATHYRKALIAIPDAPGTALIKLAEVEGLGEKLRAAGAEDAETAAAAAVLEIIDADLDGPLTGDSAFDTTLTEALEQLATPEAANQIDFARFDDLGFAFLDFDWESRFQALGQTSAAVVEEELVAAEAFLSAALAEADASAKERWRALRGATRFWLSTLADEETSAGEPARFDRWLEGSIADLGAIAPASLSLWDAVVLASAYSRSIERARADADTAPALDAAVAAFDRALADPAFDDLSEYRRRLVFDGQVLALERALVRMQADPVLTGAGPQPGETGYDRDRLADAALQALTLARLRDAVRDRAGALGLVKDDSTWSLDTPGDYYWGFTAAEAGAPLRIESGANGPATACDRLAAHPHDVERTAAPVSFAALDAEAVLAACQGDTPREMFNRARALSRTGEPDQGEILALLIEAAEAGLPIAYNNMAIVIGSLDADFVSPEDLRSTFSALSLARAYPELSKLLAAHIADAGQEQTLAWLAVKAAALDVPEAYRDLAELAAGDRYARAVNLATAELLFADAGRTAEAEEAGAALAALDLSKAELERARGAAEDRPRTDLVVIDEEIASRLLSLW